MNEWTNERVCQCEVNDDYIYNMNGLRGIYLFDSSVLHIKT